MGTFPQFEVIRIEAGNGSPILFETLDRTHQGDESWVGDGWVGVLFKDKAVTFGRWSKSGDQWCFALDKAETPPEVGEGEPIAVLGSYWGERVWLVLDRSIDWELGEFHARVNHTHDHCNICWATICEIENQQYHRGDDHWSVCPSCFDRYVRHQDISFVPVP